MDILDNDAFRDTLHNAGIEVLQAPEFYICFQLLGNILDHGDHAIDAIFFIKERRCIHNQ